METNSGLKSELKFKNDIQIIDNEGDLERQSYWKSLESLKFSKNVKEFKAQLESKFDLYLEGHLSCVLSVAVTSDNKHIISGSNDYTIRI